MYKENESSCLHERGVFLMHISVRIVIEGIISRKTNESS